MTDTLPLELAHVGVAPAKRAGVGHLAEKDVSALHRDIQVITLMDVEHSPCLGGYDDPSEVVDLPGDA